jgi:hypothetical protein
LKKVTHLAIKNKMSINHTRIKVPDLKNQPDKISKTTLLGKLEFNNIASVLDLKTFK